GGAGSIRGSRGYRRSRGSCSRIACRPGICGPWLRPRRGYWEGDEEGCPDADFTPEIHSTLEVGGHDAVDHRQPQAGALTHVLGGEEVIVDLAADLLRNPASPVLHLEPQRGLFRDQTHGHLAG